MVPTIIAPSIFNGGGAALNPIGGGLVIIPSVRRSDGILRLGALTRALSARAARQRSLIIFGVIANPGLRPLRLWRQRL